MYFASATAICVAPSVLANAARIKLAGIKANFRVMTTCTYYSRIVPGSANRAAPRAVRCLRKPDCDLPYINCGFLGYYTIIGIRRMNAELDADDSDFRPC